ncbi:hypothetical protein V6R21_07900 [Limibacter armeniacum]|uniref:hypothetical protein n=1 Tax=Limibacter armeniacum TaxID=466084 RepID=UPI002FE623C8
MEYKLINDADRAFFKAEYNEASKVLYTFWFGKTISIEEVKGGGMMMVEIARERSVKKIMNHNDNLLASWDSSLPWVSKVWVPAMEKAGVLKMAHLISTNLFAQISAENTRKIVEHRASAFDFRIFSEKEEAMFWLME